MLNKRIINKFNTKPRLYFKGYRMSYNFIILYFKWTESRIQLVATVLVKLSCFLLLFQAVLRNLLKNRLTDLFIYKKYYVAIHKLITWKCFWLPKVTDVWGRCGKIWESLHLFSRSFVHVNWDQIQFKRCAEKFA